MTFQDLINQDRDNVILNKNELAQDVIYTPDGGVNKTITAVLGDETELVQKGGRGRLSTRTMQIQISLDATAGIATPNTDDSVTINGETWAIESIKKSTNMAELGLVRITELDKGVRGI